MEINSYIFKPPEKQQQELPPCFTLKRGLIDLQLSAAMAAPAGLHGPTARLVPIHGY